MTLPMTPLQEPPRRVSPRVLLIEPLRTLRNLLVPIVLVLWAGSFSAWALMLAGLGAAGAVVLSLVRWATFTYAVAGDRLVLTRQLVSRSVRTIPFDRIRGVDISASPLQRMLGIAALEIDTGAVGEGEGSRLDGVAAAEARRLRTLLLRRSTVAGEPRPGEREAPPPEDVYVRAPRRWLLYGPLSGAYLLTPFAVVGSAIGLFFQAGGDRLIGEAVRVGDSLRAYAPVLITVAVVLLILAMPVAGLAMYAVFNWDFSLRARDGSLVAERGLLTRRSVSLERARIRGFEIVDNPLERRARVARMKAVVTGLGEARTRGQLLPSAPRDVAWAIAGRCVAAFDEPLVRHPRAALARRLFRAIAPWIAVAAVAAAAGSGWAAGVALLPALLGIPLGLDRYRSLGHAYDGRRVSVRSGSLHRRQAVVERGSIVGWTLKQTIFQRRAGLITVVAGVSAGEGGYPAIDVDGASGVEFARAVNPEWIEPFLTRPSSPRT